MEDFLNSVTWLGQVAQTSNCPWSQYRPDTLVFCEERLCAWIVSPAETWSNLLYFVVGFMILLRSRKSGQRQIRALGWLSLAIGLSSGLYHASHLYWTETLDLAVMNVLAAYLIALNFKRMKQLEPSRWTPPSSAVYSSVIFGSLIPLFLLEGNARVSVFSFWVAVIFLQEWKLKTLHPKNYAWYGLTLALIASAFACWLVDERKWICSPTTHWISGHALWHVLNSFCLYTLARFYGDRSKLPH
ncbi:MAG: hypothetical protein EOP09_04940 [Proteobacteria bacterium]|nr:MAG: hypothetical protein EOP09_04940 [Pseudomonadota bacterium]